jgi:biopolymer transport protein ExbB
MVRPGLALVLALALTGAGARAQEPKGDAPAPSAAAQPAPSARKAAATGNAGVGRSSLIGLVRQANPMLWPLVLCSIVTVGYALERLLALRRRRVLPREFVTKFHERLAAGKLDRDRAVELCKANDSPAARVFGAVLKYWGQPAATIRQALGHEAATEVSDLRRNVRVLNGTATLAPLLGLLGTVIGMIESFDALGGRAAAGTGKSEALAHGISLALMSTAFGLAIAILSVAAYYYLLNRVDVLVRDLDEQAGKVIDLVCAEATAGRPLPDRRHAVSDLGRHEPRTV